MAYFFRKEHCEHNDRYLCFSCAVKKGTEIVAAASADKQGKKKNNCENDIFQKNHIMEAMDVAEKTEVICTCEPNALCESAHDVDSFFEFCVSCLEKMPKNGEKKTLEFEHRNERREMDITIRLQMKKKNYPKSSCELFD